MHSERAPQQYSRARTSSTSPLRSIWRAVAAAVVAVAVAASVLASSRESADVAHAESSCAVSGPATYDDSFSKICAVTADGAPNTSTYKNEVNFVVVCEPTNRIKSDPIVAPGAVNEGTFMHEHLFVGQDGSASSNVVSLMAGTSNCSVPGNHTLYWSPTLLKADGTPMIPYTTRLYYRVGTMHPEKLVPIPQGLEMIAGNSMATNTTLQSPGRAGLYCRTIGQHVGGQTEKQAFPPGANGSPVCEEGTVIAQSVVFPNCWNGVVKYAKENFAYSETDGTCPSGMKNIPQLTQEDRYDLDGHHVGEENMYFSSMNSPFTLHADALEAWDRPTWDQLFYDCLMASVHCGDVSTRRMPPSSGLVPATGTGDGATMMTGSSGAPTTSVDPHAGHVMGSTTEAPTTTAQPTTGTASTTTTAPTATATPTTTTTAAPRWSTTLKPTDDAYVDSLDSARLTGDAISLRVDADPKVTSYIRFTVPSSAPGIRKVTLKLWANSSTGGGIAVSKGIENGWLEASLTGATAPSRYATSVAVVGPIVAGRWVSIDVTSLVRSTGAVTFVVRSTSSTALSLSSSEGPYAPRLVVTN